MNPINLDEQNSILLTSNTSIISWGVIRIGKLPSMNTAMHGVFHFFVLVSLKSHQFPT